MNRTQTIWKTVVFAGAMLGSAACSKSKPATTTPANDTATEAAPAEANPCATAPDPCGEGYDPCADPCADRVRGTSEEGEGDVGRGFLLS